METKVNEVLIQHPAESIFNLPEGSTVVERVEVQSEPSIVPPLYDDKDNEIDDQFQQVFDAAFGAYEAQRMSTEGMNPQFVPRALEVAAQFLSTALAAAKEKSTHKQRKDKLVIDAKGAITNNNTTNNNILMDRNEMLKMLLQEQRSLADKEPKDIN